MRPQREPTQERTDHNNCCSKGNPGSPKKRDRPTPAWKPPRSPRPKLPEVSFKLFFALIHRLLLSGAAQPFAKLCQAVTVAGGHGISGNFQDDRRFFQCHASPNS